MSLVTVYSGGSEWSGEASASRTWRLPVAGQAGEATLFVPYASSLAAIINVEAGFTVLIHDADGCGEWSGVGVSARYDAQGITIVARQPWWILGRRSTDVTGVRRAISPGFLVTTVIQSAGEVLGMTAPSAPFDGDGEVIASYNLDRQDVWSVISDAMGRGENELWVDPASREISWIGPLADADAYGPVLIAGQSLKNWSYDESNDERVSEVVGVFTQNYSRNVGSEGTYYTGASFAYSANHGESALAGWPATATVDAESTYTLAAAAHAELNRRSFPSIVISGSVSRAHAALRERAFVDVFVPRKGLTHTCRVLARTFDDANDDFDVQLQVMPTNAIATTIKPPGVVSRDTNRGTGSVAQRLVSYRRQIGRVR